ncbi:MAG: tetratricopeptide repeat protein, partial [Candidatus Zixiibacteriota bacterium]
MITACKSVMLFLAFVLISQSLSADERELKKPLDVYLRSAKIDIVAGRNDSAVVYLERLFEHYGPHAEALYWMAQIQVDFLEKASGPTAKQPYVEKMVAYIDSLNMCCENKEIKKKYRKDCKKYLDVTDSLLVKYWRQFFNDGLRQFNLAEELKADLGTIEDSVTRANMEEDIRANLDTCIQNMSLTIMCIADSSRPYLIIDKAYGIRGKYEKGIEWLKKAYEVANDSATIQQSLAYDYIQIDDYCGAIPYYQDWVNSNPGDPQLTRIMTNLSICYSRCDLPDSALALYYRILAIDPENVDMLASVGNHFNNVARAAADSVSYYMGENNQAQADVWTAEKNEAFDSARVYFGRAFELRPDDVAIAELYAVICALLEDFEAAAVGFHRLTELEPQLPGNWTYLGDCYISLKQFNKAAAAYEKVVELEPDNISVWEHL